MQNSKIIGVIHNQGFKSVFSGNDNKKASVIFISMIVSWRDFPFKAWCHLERHIVLHSTPVAKLSWGVKQLLNKTHVQNINKGPKKQNRCMSAAVSKLQQAPQWLCAFPDPKLDIEIWKIRMPVMLVLFSLFFFLPCFWEKLLKRWDNLSHHVSCAFHGGPAYFN